MIIGFQMVCNECGGDEFRVLDLKVNRHECVHCGLVFLDINGLHWMRAPY